VLTSPEVDSRHYVFALPLHSPEDIPRDFGYRRQDDFLAGVFLPRDDPDWFGRSGYPARLLLLFEGHVAIVPHPKSPKAAPTYLGLEDVEAVESGQALLVGWIRLHSRQTADVPYNRRTSAPVERWLQALRHRLCPKPDVPPRACHMVGDPLDIKFTNALAAESEAGEQAATVWFKAPVARSVGTWIFSRRTTGPGHLIAAMSDRLLWLTDRMGRGRERYGYVATYAPLRHIENFSIEPDMATVTLKSGIRWEVRRSGEPPQGRP